MGQNKIICSGVSAGTTDVVKEYTQHMSNIVLGVKDLPRGGETNSKLSNIYQEALFPACERNGVVNSLCSNYSHRHYNY